ncbi:hypothetical protein CAPTEDRAFT_189071 [Capitella teleta]|uniref:Uncharacterized protein n=1 Tax=Capitella teleta TaxID=283909 RepID=R7UWE3_CAPTE|nr:hypothetical protein CAPTEDRAFT_189071 [Capitella teleta]|eukprot:ELU07696.1 hypothetical protein CAPTEDRAFT_189071 [Capitella teleta]
MERPPPSYNNLVENEGSQEAKGMFWKELSTFLDFTSAHGLPHVRRVKHKIAKAVWAILCLVSIGTLIFEVYIIVGKFVGRPVNVLVEIKFDRTIQYPAVTICNLNPYRKSQMEKFDDVFDDMKGAFDKMDIPDLKKRRKRSLDRRLTKALEERHRKRRGKLAWADCATLDEDARSQIESLGHCQFQIDRVGEPFTNCTSEETDGIQNIYAANIPRSYTLNVCEVSCYQYHLVTDCGCADAQYPMEAAWIPDSIAACVLSNDTEKGELYTDTMLRFLKVQNVPKLIVKCEDSHWEKYSTGHLICDCPQVCHEVKYLPTISQALWPLPRTDYMDYYIGQLRKMRKPSLDRWLKEMDNDDDLSETSRAVVVRNNVAKLDIYYEDLNYERIYQTEAYTETQLISDFGGQLGLWMGLSMLSLVEVFELIYRVIKGLCMNKISAQPQQKNAASDEPSKIALSDQFQLKYRGKESGADLMFA